MIYSNTAICSWFNFSIIFELESSAKKEDTNIYKILAKKACLVIGQ